MTEQRGLLDRSITRRNFLVGSGLAGVAAFIAACGTSGSPTTAPTTAPTEAPTAAASTGPTPAPSVAATPSATLNWANWCCYLDVDPKDPTKWKTLEDFQAAYGTVVTYKEVIEGNEDFFGTIKDALSAGQDTSWDIITLTDWMAAKLIRLNWIEEFDPANMPSFAANLRDVYRGYEWDPDMKHHAPWQSGMTGIGYDPSVTGPITSLKAFFTVDPRWKGKVEYLTEMRDTMGLAMLALGLDPTKPTRDDCDKAVAAMLKARADGIVRDVKGNSYTEDLKLGDAVLVMAWSGDIVQTKLDKPTLEFAIADEGAMFWTDNCMIPKGAAHKGTAELMIDWCYVPEHAAQIEAGISYVTPVKGVQEIYAASTDNAALATDPLRFPPADQASRLKAFGILTEEDDAYFNQQFAKVIGV
jgi:spermidine/putrescine transport system substrate-binding protein